MGHRPPGPHRQARRRIVERDDARADAASHKRRADLAEQLSQGTETALSRLERLEDAFGEIVELANALADYALREIRYLDDLIAKPQDVRDVPQEYLRRSRRSKPGPRRTPSHIASGGGEARGWTVGRSGASYASAFCSPKNEGALCSRGIAATPDGGGCWNAYGAHPVRS